MFLNNYFIALCNLSATEEQFYIGFGLRYINENYMYYSYSGISRITEMSDTNVDLPDTMVPDHLGPWLISRNML